jgi:hypothetical protein
VSPFGRAIPAEDGEGTSHLVGATSPGEAVEQNAAMWGAPSQPPLVRGHDWNAPIP